MEEKLTFEELYEAYLLCLKNKKRKIGTYNFVNDRLCVNLVNLLDELNERRYIPKPSNCYVITDPALREIYAAQFSDRIVQHLYMKEIDEILEKQLIDGCCSCRKGKGNEYALELLKRYVVETSENGTKDCFFLKIDLSGYFMSIDRKQVSDKFAELIKEHYTGHHKELLTYLTPIIFQNNPSEQCVYKCNEKTRNKVPERRKMNANSKYGMAIGNLTSQAGSNVNLNDFDKYVVKELNLDKYVRYVDDIIIVSSNKEELKSALPHICERLILTNQMINQKKTKIETAYYGIAFLGKVTYPYGYQKAKKTTIIRTYYKARSIIYENVDNLLAKVNSQIGTLKGFNCRKVIENYVCILKNNINGEIKFDNVKIKFSKIK